MHYLPCLYTYHYRYPDLYHYHDPYLYLYTYHHPDLYFDFYSDLYSDHEEMIRGGDVLRIR